MQHVTDLLTDSVIALLPASEFTFCDLVSVLVTDIASPVLAANLIPTSRFLSRKDIKAGKDKVDPQYWLVCVSQSIPTGTWEEVGHLGHQFGA